MKSKKKHYFNKFVAATTENSEVDNTKTERKTIIKLKYNEKEIDNKIRREIEKQQQKLQ